MTSAPGIGFEYRPSRWPTALLVTLGALSLAAIAYSGVDAWLAVLLVLAVMAYATISFRRGRACRVREAMWRADGGWQLRLHDDTTVEARLLEARQMAGAIVLRLGWTPKHREALLLFPDNLDADTRRRLRMRLSEGTDTD
jgi:toxin CptA